jgi:hypothetical protein
LLAHPRNQGPCAFNNYSILDYVLRASFFYFLAIMVRKLSILALVCSALAFGERLSLALPYSLMEFSG